MDEEQEQQFQMSAVLAVVKRRLGWIVIPAVLGPVIALGISYALKPVYTSTAFVLIQQPKVPDRFVPQVITDQIDSRLMTLKEQILSRSRLEPIVTKMDLYGGPKSKLSMEEKVQILRGSITVQTLKPDSYNRVPSGFYVMADADSAHRAQQICTDILAMFMEENLKLRQQRAAGTTEFLSEQLDESKRKLDEYDAQLAQFKGKYLGQLPSDEQRNLEMLTTTRTRLEALNQELNMAQQQKIVQETTLAQLSSRRPSRTEADPNEMERQLAGLRDQLANLQSRYTSEYPEVVKVKAQIEALQGQLKSAPTTQTTAKENPQSDTPEMRQLRMALRLSEETIRSRRAEQASLEKQVNALQGRLQLSPVIEEQYKSLTRDHDTAQQFYNDLLNKKTQAEMSTDLERRQEGEQFSIMDRPDLPAKPVFPNRVMFAMAGLGAGLALGCLLAFIREKKEQFIRNEDDVLQTLRLPLLVSIPEVGKDEKPEGTPVAYDHKTLELGART